MISFDFYDDQLRDYQQKNKELIYKSWNSGIKSVLLQMPTGTGKTHLFASIVKDIHNKSSQDKIAYKVLILVHRQELVDQISHTLGVKYNVAYGLIMSGARQQDFIPTQIASIQTLTQRLDNWNDVSFKYIIIDEAHHALAKSYKRVMKTFSKALVLGVTATPYRLSGESFESIFNILISLNQISYFIDRGHLSKYDYYSIEPTSEIQKAIDNIDTYDVDGDYKISAMRKIIDTNIVQANILDSYIKYAKGKKGIVYTINRTHNNNVCKAFCEAGFKAKAIDSKTSKEVRENVIKEFRNNIIDIICNVNIFSEGFDCPDIEFIQLARPTTSLSMYLQQVGRGLRKHPNIDRVIFLDNVGSYNKFGLPSSYRDWNRYFKGFDKNDTANINSEKESFSNHCSLYSLEDGFKIIESNKKIEKVYTSNGGLIQDTQVKLDLPAFELIENFLIPPTEIYLYDETFATYDDWVDNLLVFHDLEEDAEDFNGVVNSRLRKVGIGGLIGIYDTIHCELVLPVEYNSIEGPSSYNKSIIEKNGKFGVFCVKDLKLNIQCEYQEIKPLEYKTRKNQFIVKKDEFYGIIDEFNNILVPCIYNEIFPIFISNDFYFLAAFTGDYYVLIDENNSVIDRFKVLDQIIHNNRLEVNLNVASNDKFYFALGNCEGRMLFPFLFKKYEVIQNFILAKFSNNRYGLIDENLNFILSPKYTKIGFYCQNYFCAFANGCSKVYNIKDSTLLDLNVSQCEIRHGLLCVYHESSWHIIDLKGKIYASKKILKDLIKSFLDSALYKNNEYPSLESKTPSDNNSAIRKPERKESNRSDLKKINLEFPSITIKKKVKEEKKAVKKVNETNHQVNQNIDKKTDSQILYKKKRPRIKVALKG